MSKRAPKQSSAPKKGPKKKGGKPPKKESTPAWQTFTKVSVAFKHAARDLESALKESYGDSTTISHYERFIKELPTLSQGQKSLIYLDQATYTLYKDYLAKREARDAERLSFRAESSGQSVAAGLEEAESLFGLTAADHEPSLSDGNDADSED